MDRRLYQRIALISFVPAWGLAAVISPKAIRIGRSLLPGYRVVTAVLAVLLCVLATTVLWGIAMLPLRRRTDLGGLDRDLAEIRRLGGVRAAFELEQEKLASLKEAGPARVRAHYHLRLALGGIFVTAIASLAALLLWAEGWWSLTAIGAAVISPLLTLYHGVRWLMLRRAPR